MPPVGFQCRRVFRARHAQAASEQPQAGVQRWLLAPLA
jgi:hypothetical protein